MNLHGTSFLFFMPIWLKSGWWSIFFCNDVGILFLSFHSNSNYYSYFTCERPVWLYFFLNFCFTLMNHSVCNLMMYLCAHLPWLPVIFLLLSGILGYSCMFLSYLCSCSFWECLCLCLSCGWAWIANLLWDVVALVFTSF